MAVKIRLQRHGRGKRPFYHIVAADARARRDGKYIERIGDYNPLTSPASIHLDTDKAIDWLLKGAEPTDTVHAILKYKGVMFKKHLLRGVDKGAMTMEECEQKFQKWQDEHQNSVLDHKKKEHKSKEERLIALMADETKKKEERENKRKEAIKAAEAANMPVIEAVETAPKIEESAPVAEEVAAPAAEEAAPAAEAPAE